MNQSKVALALWNYMCKLIEFNIICVACYTNFLYMYYIIFIGLSVPTKQNFMTTRLVLSRFGRSHRVPTEPTQH